MRVVDLSHTIENGLITYKGLPAPVICDYLSREASRNVYEPGTEFQIGKIEMVGNTGTYMDCPFHRYAEGKDFSDYPAALFTDIDAVVIRVPFGEQKAIGPAYFEKSASPGKAILVHTGWSVFWNTATYYEDHPYLTADAAALLSDRGVRVVGIDSHNIDNTAVKSRPVHSKLLANEIFIVEHLTRLDLLPASGITFTALPPKIKGMGTFPVRAIAKIPG